MAYVDFSNAHIECLDRQAFTLLQSQYLGLYSTQASTGFALLKTENFESIARIERSYLGNITSNGFTVYCSGVFNSSGNAFDIRSSNANYTNNSFHAWRISGIEFEAEDIFSFQINVTFNYQ